jgi:hypothetical protein
MGPEKIHPHQRKPNQKRGVKWIPCRLDWEGMCPSSRRPDLIDDAVQDNHLSVEVFEGPEAKVAVGQ